MCAIRKAPNPIRKKRSSDIINTTSPIKENRMPNPNQSAAPSKPTVETNQMNKHTMTAGLATISNLNQFFCKASASSPAKTNAVINRMCMNALIQYRTIKKTLRFRAILRP